MPWKETRIMDERMRFILAVEDEEKKETTQFFTRLCASFGIKPATGYKWIARFNKGGAVALTDRARVAGSCPHATPPEVVDKIVALRKQRPHDGPKKIHALLLEQHPGARGPGREHHRQHFGESCGWGSGAGPGRASSRQS